MKRTVITNEMGTKIGTISVLSWSFERIKKDCQILNLKMDGDAVELEMKRSLRYY